jgi:hypothetical protein
MRPPLSALLVLAIAPGCSRPRATQGPSGAHIEISAVAEGTCAARIAIRVSNDSPTRIDIAKAYESSAIDVDNVRHSLQMFRWGGSAGLGPRDVWTTELWPNDYGVPSLSEGSHAIRVEIAGTRSRELRVAGCPITIGMSRTEVEHLVAEDGGLQVASPHRYVQPPDALLEVTYDARGRVAGPVRVYPGQPHGD